jgi:uncharacterized phage protein (TIGR01671 family)
MREIKFRAWDKTKNVMLDRVLAGCNQDNMSYICNLVWIEDKKDWLHFDEGCGYIMQYTGLKDKNGKEIYEGDIVCGYDDGNEGECGAEYFGVVFWDEDSASFKFKDMPLNEEYPADDYLYDRVCGNVYENPELLLEVGE